MIIGLKRWFCILTIMMLAATAHAQSGKLDAAYLCGQDGTCTYSPLVPQRYELVVTTECGAWHDQLKADNANVMTFIYTSGTDNYTFPHVADDGWYYGSREHAWLKQRCQELGYSPEILYMHYYENTVVSDHSIPGTYSSTLTDADSVSRVPVYLNYYDGSGVGRILVNFSHPITRQLQIEYAKKAWTDPNAGSDWPQSSYWDGYYIDNWVANEIHPDMGQIGRVTSGGRLAEHPTHGVIGTSETVLWYQEQMNTYARQLRDTLHNGAAWSPDGKPKYLCGNIANTWIWDFADPAVGGLDYLLQEYQYNPIRSRAYVVPHAYSRDSACYAHGVYNLYCSLQTMSPSTGDGSVTQSEALYDNLAWYYVTRSPNTYMYQYHQGPSTYYISEAWDSLTWRGCMEFDVGTAQGHYSILQSGTDPVGYPYDIFQREYSKALVLLRARGQWNEDVTPQTAVAVNLPTAYREVQIDGSLGPLSATFTLRNGRGLILAKPDAGQSDIIAPSPLDPTHGEVIQNQQPTLTVKDAEDPESRSLLYQFQLDTEGDFGGVDLVESSSGDISTPGDTTTAWDVPQQLADGSSYYWRSRVITTSGAADTSDWSWAFQFSVSIPSENNCPTPPTPVSPENGAETTDITPSLEVQNSYDADEDPLTYGFVVCSNSAMTNIVASTSGRSEGSGSTAWTVSPQLSGGQTYYWYARAHDGQCYSSWSAVRSFTITTGTGPNDPPPIPSGEAPIDGDTTTSAGLQLIVENVEDPEGDQVWYQFLLKKSNGDVVDIEDNIEEGSGSTTSWSPDVVVPKNQAFTWRVQTHDYTSYSGWSTHYSFYLKNLSPPQPAPYSPLNDDTLLSQNVVLSLNNVTDPDGEDVTYEFQVFADPGLTNLVAQASGISAGVDRTSWLASFTPQDGATYYWQGRAEDQTEAGSWSDTQAFVTSWLVVDVEGNIPQLLSPANGIRINELRPQFQLRLPPEALGEKCELEIATDLDFGEQRIYSGEIDVASSMITWSASDDFAPGETYYWRARLVGGEWSRVAAFTVEIDIHFAPNPYVLTDGATVTIYNLPAGSEVKLYTVSGRLVVTLTNDNESELQWDVTNDHGEPLAPGVYLYTVHSSQASIKGKFVVSP